MDGKKMDQSAFNILSSGEIESYVQNLHKSKIEDLGSPLWFEAHHRLQKLNQQSSMEVIEMREESVKDLIISYGKIPIIIHEAICIQVWREKIFRQIVKLNQQPQNTFIAYIILFHEITAVSLLANVMYHNSSLEEIDDALVDLVDYCASEITRLLSEDYTKLEETASNNLSNLEELKSHCRTISFNIGLSAISILRYLTEFMNDLPLPAIARMYKTHDLPLLMVNLIQMAPWKRTNPKTNVIQIFEDRMWKNIDKISGISKYEGQCWLALRFLLINLSHCQYEMNESKKQQILKIQKFLTEILIDQIPPLIDLKNFFSHLMLRNLPINIKKPLIMETIPEIKNNILKECYKKWKKITKKQIESVFFAKRDILMEITKSLGSTYDLDHLEKLSPEGPICSNCGDVASKRCSKCKNEWYCGRECQVKRWTRHKSICDLMSKK